MDKKFIALFQTIMESSAALAEQVIEYDMNKGDTAGAQVATTMRDDYTNLYEKLKDPNFDGTLSRTEFAKILVSTLIIANNLRDKITALNKVAMGYEKDIIPKLQAVIDEADDKHALDKANELFIIENEN